VVSLPCVYRLEGEPIKYIEELMIVVCAMFWEEVTG